MSTPKVHTVVITQPDSKSDDYEFEVTCPETGSCSLWTDCRDCKHEPTEDEGEAGEYDAHDIHHQYIDGYWMTDTGKCASLTTDSGADGLRGIADQFGIGTHRFHVDYWGDEVWDIIHVPAESVTP
jgi:hypothetical protein